MSAGLLVAASARAAQTVDVKIDALRPHNTFAAPKAVVPAPFQTLIDHNQTSY
jgi:hypothetical protein